MARASETRRQAIVELSRAEPLAVDALAARFEVTESTIRRDLAMLAEQGRIVRTFGGAAAGGEPSLSDRETMAVAQKNAIADVAVRYVADGQQVVLDAGSTTGAMARKLAVSGHRLSVLTTGLSVLRALAGVASIQTMATGGSLRPISLGFVGPMAEQSLAHVTCDAAFVSADGLTAARGLCEASAEQARLKDRIIAMADHLYVLADADKIGRASAHWWSALPTDWTLITDTGVDSDALQAFENLPGCRVIVAAGA